MATSDIAITTASPADLGELLRLEHASFLPADVFSRRQYRDLLANPRATIRVVPGDAGAGGRHRLLASAILLRGPGRSGSARLYSIAVDPCCRGQGLGSRLLADVIDICLGEGLGRLSLEVRADNGPAIAMYRRFGFAEESTLPDYYGPDQPGVRMSLAISQQPRGVM